MVKTLNKYKVLDRNWVFAPNLMDIDDVQLAVSHCLQGRGFTIEESKSLSSDIALFMKPNKYDVLVKVTPTTQRIELPKQNETTNRTLGRLRVFNGKSLKLNSPETCRQSYKPGRNECKEVRFAESVFTSKGQSVIFSQTKRQKNEGVIDTETAEKVANLTAHGYFSDTMSVTNVIENCLKSLSPTETYRKLKGKVGLGSNELNRLIYKLTHS